MAKILEFRISKSSYKNDAKLSYHGICDGIDSVSGFDKLFPPQNEDGEDDLETLNAEWTDGSGNSVDLTNEEVKSGIGTINFDNEYDTIYTVFANEVNENEAQLIFNEAQLYNGKYCFNQPLFDMLPDAPISLLQEAAQNGTLMDLYNQVNELY